MRVARAVFFAGPAVALLTVLALGASFVADRRHGRSRRPVPDDDVDTPAPPPQREIPARRVAAAPPPPAPDETDRFDSLRLRVDGPHGLRLRSISVALAPSADDQAGQTDDDGEGEGDEGDDREVTTYEADAEEDGTFVIDDVPAGRYDITVSADGLADAHLLAVPSNAVGVRVALARPPVLIGAVGSVHGPCAERPLTVDQGGDPREQVLDDDCSFDLRDLERGRPVTVSVSLDDHDAGAIVPIPAEGDPPPLCLAPPCASLPSALVVLFADSDGFLDAGDISYAWDTSSEEGGRGGAGTSSGLLVIDSLVPGARVHLNASGDGPSVDAQLTARFGISEVIVTLPPGADEEE